MNSLIQQGRTALEQGNLHQATELFRLAHQDNSRDPQVIACLGQTLCWQGKREEGLKYLRQSGALLLKKARKTRDTNLLLDLADQLQHWNDYVGSLDLCKQSVQINPTDVRGFQILALSHSRLNQHKPALAAGRQALKLVPESAMLAILLATLEITAGLVEEAKQRLEKVLKSSLLKPEEKFRAHKELARALDKLGIHAQVFEHLHAAGDIAPHLPAVRKQDSGLVPKLLETNKAEFDQGLLGRWANAAFPKDQAPPVFLVGFMRTGTTLTQEVLDAHPKIFVADETDLIMSVIQELKRLSPDQSSSIPQMLNNLDLAGVLHLRGFYWQRANALFGDKLDGRVFLDKTTMNSIDLGLINCLFPDAKLIFLLRDPRDVCLSCFMQTMLPTPSTVHLLTWEGTARFYAQIMDWWQTVKPKLSMAYTELRYEDAVFDFEPTFRGIFEFIGLDWDPAAADFHKFAAKKYIASPSFNQVAQPLYSSSVSRWRFYADEYEKIAEWLKPFIDAFDYR